MLVASLLKAIPDKYHKSIIEGQLRSFWTAYGVNKKLSKEKLNPLRSQALSEILEGKELAKEVLALGLIPNSQVLPIAKMMADWDVPDGAEITPATSLTGLSDSFVYD